MKCALCRNFAQLTAPLTAMTRKECGWKGGELPKAALQSFRELQLYLCSEPIVAYPRRNRTYTLITNASLGLAVKPAGLGAILTQLDEKGDHMSSPMKVESCRSTNAIIPHFYLRCKPLFGVWTILTPTYEAGCSFCSPIIDLWKSWVRCTQKL